MARAGRDGSEEKIAASRKVREARGRRGRERSDRDTRFPPGGSPAFSRAGSKLQLRREIPRHDGVFCARFVARSNDWSERWNEVLKGIRVLEPTRRWFVPRAVRCSSGRVRRSSRSRSPHRGGPPRDGRLLPGDPRFQSGQGHRVGGDEDAEAPPGPLPTLDNCPRSCTRVTRSCKP